MESFRRYLFIDMVVDRFTFENNQNTLAPSPSYPKQVWDYHKTGLSFKCVCGRIRFPS